MRWLCRTWTSAPRGGWHIFGVNAPDSKAAIEAARRKHPRAGEIQVEEYKGRRATSDETADQT